MIPSYLYHYTSIDSLKLILSNGTIRFKRLDLLNDPLESYSEKFDSFRKNVFSSSWTAEPNESIPMWKIYSNFDGVRLKLPIDIFSFNNEPRLMKTNLGLWFIVSDLDKKYEVNRTCNFIKTEANIELLNVIKKVYGPTKIEYTSQQQDYTKEVVIPILDSDTDQNTINLNMLGLRKKHDWSFENEYRYRVMCPDVSSIKSAPAVIKLLLDNCQIVEDYIDIEFNISKVQSFEILLGPKVLDNDENELEAFLKSLNVNYEILKSCIDIR
jgi:hypothetical protein